MTDQEIDAVALKHVGSICAAAFAPQLVRFAREVMAHEPSMRVIERLLRVHLEHDEQTARILAQQMVDAERVKA